LLSANECKCRDIFTAVGNLGELVLEITDVRLEAVALSLLTMRWWLFFLAFCGEAYWVRNALVISSKF